MPLPWAGSSGAVKARQPTNDQMQRFSRASQCQAQGATGGGSGLAGAPPPHLSGRQIHARTELAHQSGRFSERMVPILPLPQSQTPICPHGLTSNSLPRTPRQIHLTVLHRLQETKPNHLALKSKSRHFSQVVMLDPKLGHWVIMVQLPSPEFKTFPAGFV